MRGEAGRGVGRGGAGRRAGGGVSENCSPPQLSEPGVFFPRNFSGAPPRVPGAAGRVSQR